MTLTTLILLGSLISPALTPVFQAEDGPLKPQLKEADHIKVGAKMRDYIDYMIKGDQRREGKAYKIFEKEFQKASRKTAGKNLLKYPADLVEILHSCSTWTKRGLSTGRASTGVSPHHLVKWVYRLPKDYDPKKIVLPLLYVFLPPREIKAARSIITESWSGAGLDENFCVAALSLPAEEADRSVAALRTFATIVQTIRIDHRRVILATEGDNAPFALEFANDWPHRFAGVALMNPSGKVPEVSNLGSIPVYIEGGDEKFAKAMTDAGIKVTKGEGGAVKIAEWAADLQRVPYPTKVHFLPVNRTTRQAYWIRIDPGWSLDDAGQVNLAPAVRPSVVAEIDREKNQITARVKHVLQIEFLLSDGMLDLDKPILIDINGQVNEIRKTRSLSFFIRYFIRTGERGVVYTTSFIRMKKDIPKLEEEKDK